MYAIFDKELRSDFTMIIEKEPNRIDKIYIRFRGRKLLELFVHSKDRNTGFRSGGRAAHERQADKISMRVR